MPRTAPVATPRRAPAATGVPVKWYRSSIGQKAVMAVSGAILVLFLVAHMLGDLKIFLGRHTFDEYASWLRTLGKPALPYRTFLTSMEVMLAVAVVAHMWAAVSLARRARKARPVRYEARPTAQENRYATKVMRYGGVVIALFVVWHVLDLTFGVANPRSDGLAYDKVVADFDPSRWYITIFYVAAVIMVGYHLRHGLFSAVQTLGRGRQDRYRALRITADTIAVATVVGYVSVPIMVTIGVVK